MIGDGDQPLVYAAVGSVFCFFQLAQSEISVFINRQGGVNDGTGQMLFLKNALHKRELGIIKHKTAPFFVE